MTNDKKMELAANIVIAVLSNSTAHYEDRLECVPKYLESIYNKIDELSKNGVPKLEDVI